MIRKFLFFLFVLFYSIPIYATSPATPFGASLSILLVPKDPDNLRGYRLAILYAPPRWNWEHVNIYLDASYGHWWLRQGGPYGSVSTWAVAPYLRYYVMRKPACSPYFEISVGPTYLTKLHLDSQKLGMHFCFQDQFTFGSAFFSDERLNMAITVLHYSNASFANHNSGITVPLILNVGYRF